MGNSVYSTPVVANNVLYIANKDALVRHPDARKIGTVRQNRRGTVPILPQSSEQNGTVPFSRGFVRPSQEK